MGEAIATVNGGAQMERADVIGDDKIALVKRTIAKGATDDELELFISTCRRLALDPFARQIYAVKQWDGQERREVMRSQVSIDGFRLVAQRTGQYRGQTEPQWCGADGKWTTVWLSDEPPAAARVGVHRDGFAEPLYAVARWRDYVQTKKDGSVNSMWRKFGPTMLSKCAEMQALRKAFPMELSGVYGREEMMQSEPPTNASEAAALPSVAHDADDSEIASWRKSLAECQDVGALAGWFAEARAKLDADNQRRLNAQLNQRAKDLGTSVKALMEAL